MITTPAPRGRTALLPLTDRPGDTAIVRVLADVDADIAPRRPGSDSAAWALAPFRGAVLVEVSAGARTVLPGAWAAPRDLAALEPTQDRAVRSEDLRMPAVVREDGTDAALVWGETVWPLPFDASVAIPGACRPAVHSTAALRRLCLAALGRRGEVGLTLWRAPDFVVPWHDVRLMPRAAWWFSVAQVPTGMRYADAARSQGVDVEGLLEQSLPGVDACDHGTMSRPGERQR